MRSPEDDADLVALFVRLLGDIEDCPCELSALYCTETSTK